MNSYKAFQPAVCPKLLWPPHKTNCLPLCTHSYATLHRKCQHLKTMISHNDRAMNFKTSLYNNAVQLSNMLDNTRQVCTESILRFLKIYMYVPGPFLHDLTYLYRYYKSTCTALMSEWFCLYSCWIFTSI